MPTAGQPPQLGRQRSRLPTALLSETRSARERSRVRRHPRCGLDRMSDMSQRAVDCCDDFDLRFRC